MVQLASTTDIGKYNSSSLGFNTSASRKGYTKQFGKSIRKLMGIKTSDHHKKKSIPELELVLDKIRRDEYSRLDDSNTVYLDYAGASLYPKSLLTMHHAFLEQHVLGNPHSGSPA